VSGFRFIVSLIWEGVIMATQSVKFEGWPHVVRSQQFSRDWLERVFFPLSDKMEKIHPAQRRNLLLGREMISMFVAESTRTRASFEIAMRRLGGEVIFHSEAGAKFSGMAKGESLEDTILVLNEYGADVIVLRQAEEGGAERAAAISSVPIINAGDGPGQHPTQALLDLYTIRKHMGRIDGLQIALIGDVEGSRTIHSLAFILGRFSGVTIHFVALDHQKVKPEILESLRKHGVEYTESRDIRAIASKVDVFYQTRTQVNLGTKPCDRTDEAHGFTVINGEVRRRAKPAAIFMHPLPCNEEIVRAEVDSDPRAVYIQTKDGRISQVRCGYTIKLALLVLVMEPKLAVKLLKL